MAHIKYISPSGWDFERPVAMQMKYSSRGLRGNDLRDFTKTAGHSFSSQLDHIKIAKDEVPVHLIALGAYEHYGLNRNGDGFTKDACEKCHHTFVKFAKFFRNHCFVAGTNVVMANRIRKPIEQVKAGEKVTTRFGKHRVLRTMKELYTGSGVEFKFSGVPVSTRVTTEHPYLILRREQIHCKHRYSRLIPSEHGFKCRDWRQGLTKMQPQFVAAKDVKKGDYVLIVSPTSGNVPVEPAFAQLVGWVASEGYLGDPKKGTIQFTFSNNNHADIESVTSCLRSHGLNVTQTPRPETNCLMLTTSSPEMHRELSKYVKGVKAHKMLIVENVLKWDKAAIHELLAAYIDGDGHIASGKNMGQLRIRSSSKQMLYSLSDLVRCLGIPATVQLDKKVGTMVCPSNGYVYNASASGVVSVDAQNSIKLTRQSRKFRNRLSNRINPIKLFDGMYLAKVTQTKAIELNEFVYNLEIEKDHTYIANEVIVHNCNKPDKGDPHFGIVKASAWNEPMKRIELIVALNADKSAVDRNGGFLADIELQKLANDESFGVSMACRIPHDVCTYCGKQSATRADYCDDAMCKAGGCKDNISRIVKVAGDMHHLGVLNPNPVWFDISRVFRPADRIAFGAKADYLTKAAADDGIFSIADSIKMAEDATAPLGVIMYQDGRPGSWTARIVGQVKIASGLAVLESQETGRSPVYLGLDTKPMDVSKLGEPGTEKCAESLSALADKKIILTLRDFATLTGQSEVVKQASEQMTDIYGRLINSDRLERIVEQNRFLLSDKVASDKNKSIAIANFSDHSLEMNAITSRSMVAAANNFNSETVKAASDSSQDYCASSRRLAENYAVYKLDALERIARYDDNLALTARLAVRQNHLA